jgi:DNA-binding NarL/FixJ family response regulator
MQEFRPDEGTREAIIVVDDEPFSQDCLIEALRGSFPDTLINGVGSLDELYRSEGITVALVLLKAERFRTSDAIANAVRSLDRSSPDAPVVLICADDEFDVLQAIGAGVKGVVPVTASLRVGVAALRLVMAGGTYYPRPGPSYLASNGATGNGHSDSIPLPPATPPVLIAVNRSLPSIQTGLVDRPSPLLGTNGSRVTFTTREADVLALLQKGHSNKWIADHLKLSENTVKVHIQHIMRKLHATNRTEAVILSVSHLETY